MSIFRTILSWLFVLIVIASVGLYVFVTRNGQQIAQQRLAQLFDRPVTVGEARFIFPFGVRLDDIRVEGIFRAKTIRLQLELPLYLNNQFIVSKMRLEQPVFSVKRREDGLIAWEGDPTADDGKADTTTVEQNEVSSGSLQKGVLIQYFEIEQGEISFWDLMASDDFRFTLDQLDLKASSLTYPFRNKNAKFEMKGRFMSDSLPFSGSAVFSEGLINFIKKDMDVTLKIHEPDGKINLSSDLKSVDNAMTVEGTINLNDLEKKVKGPVVGPRTPVLGGYIIDNLAESVATVVQSIGIHSESRFSFQTAMDNFRLGKVQIEGTALYKGEKEGLAEDLKNIGKQFEEIGKKLTEGSPPEAVEK